MKNTICTTVLLPSSCLWAPTINWAGGGDVSGKLPPANGASLPVELVDFLVKKRNENTVDLTQQTAPETNASHFASEPARGPLTDRHLFSYTDQMKSGPKNQIYYRLRPVDLDGSFGFGPVRSVQAAAAAPGQLWAAIF